MHYQNHNFVFTTLPMNKLLDVHHMYLYFVHADVDAKRHKTFLYTLAPDCVECISCWLLPKWCQRGVLLQHVGHPPECISSELSKSLWCSAPSESSCGGWESVWLCWPCLLWMWCFVWMYVIVCTYAYVQNIYRYSCTTHTTYAELTLLGPIVYISNSFPWYYNTH